MQYVHNKYLKDIRLQLIMNTDYDYPNPFEKFMVFLQRNLTTKFHMLKMKYFRDLKC